MAQAELCVAEVVFGFPSGVGLPHAHPNVRKRSDKYNSDAATGRARIYSAVSGMVLSLEIAGVQGNEATIAIAVLTKDQVQRATGGGPLPASPVAANGTAGSTPDVTTDEDRTVAMVIKVADGNTATFRVGGVEETIHFIGTDTPETVHPDKGTECYGPEARDFAKSVLTPGSTVYLEFDAERRDTYGRLLAYLWPNDARILNVALVAQGYARPLAFRPNTRSTRQFEQLANKTRRKGVGLWGVCEE